MANYTGSVPDIAARRLDWQADAVCRTDPELFFDGAREDEAKRTCHACPVLVACQSWVMDTERGLGLYHREGIVAGLTPVDRLALDPDAPKPAPDEDKPKRTRKTAPPKHGTRACYRKGCRREECKAAAREYSRDLKRRKTEGGRAPKKRDAPAACPSVAAYRRHVKKHEPIDPGCREAYVKHRAALRQDKRARQVYALWTKGLSDPDIAARLSIGVRAVRNTREQLGLLPNLHTRKAS